MHVRLTLSFITAIFILSLYVNLACEVWGTDEEPTLCCYRKGGF